MEIRWADVEYTREPGPHEVAGIVLEVHARDVRLWEEHPKAVFNVVLVSPVLGPTRFVLGSPEKGSA